MSSTWEKVPFGATGLRVTPLGLGSSYGLGGADVERACERGVNLLFWGLRRRGSFGDGIRRVAARDRDGVVIAAQSYTRLASFMEPSLDLVLRALRIDAVDLLCLGWWDDLPPERILDGARLLREKGKAKHLMISCHHRPSFEKLVAIPGMDAIMVRYNAAHPGAERDVFPHLGSRAPGVLAFTATRWGSLLRPELVPEGEPTPRASDCYRFVLSSPHVHASLAGPKDGAELDEAMAALDRGPMSAEELGWMRRVGARVKTGSRGQLVVGTFDRLRSAVFGSP